MTRDEWLEANNRYLSASLGWLRLRLQRMMPETARLPGSTDESPNPPPAEETKGGWFRSRRESRRTEAREVRLLSPGKGEDIDEQIALAAAERDAAAATDPPPALHLLAERFGLSVFERDTLLLCAALEFDPAMTWLCAQAQGGSSRPWPTFGLALSVLDDPSWDAISVHRPLRYARLIEINQPGGTPLTSSALRADERIVNFLKGLNVMDEWLGTLLAPVGEDPRELLTESQKDVAEVTLQRLQEAIGESALPVVQLLGSDPASKVAVANWIALALNRQLYRLSLEAVPQQTADVETLARLWQRETFLLPVALYISAEQLDGASTETQNALRRFLSRGIGLAFLSLPETPVPWIEQSILATVRKPTPEEQREAWRSRLAPGTGSDADRAASVLTGQFNLNLGDIRKVAGEVAGGSSAPASVLECAWDACLDLTRPKMDSLAQRLELKSTWEDLVLPEEQMTLLPQIAGQVRHRHQVYEDWGFARRMNRGLGISALFAGESGTGKTMAAEVIANDLRLEPLPHRSLGGGEQVHRRDRKEPAPAVRRGRGWRRDSVLRRGRRAVRQAQRSEGQPRPLRQYRDQLSAAAHGGVSAGWRSWRPT